MDPLIGQSIAGKFRLERLLGEGGMGRVYVATELGSGQEVALKLLNEELAKDEGVSRRFEREAEAARRLNHPNSVRLIDSGRDEAGRLYLAMELLSGESLYQRLEKKRILPPEEAVGILRQVLSSLAACHKAGIVHRDLKPDNIFLVGGPGAEGLVKVLDYGIARLADGPTVTKTGQALGTPTYMAPEQILRSKAVGPSVDIYSVGVIAFELLTGRPPFREKSHAEVFKKHMYDAPPTLERARPGHPELAPFEPVVKRALEKSQVARYSSAEELSRALEEALAASRLIPPGEGTQLLEVDELIPVDTEVHPEKTEAILDRASGQTLELGTEGTELLPAPGTLNLEVEATIPQPRLELPPSSPRPEARALPQAIPRLELPKQEAEVPAALPRIPRVKPAEPPAPEAEPFFTSPGQPRINPPGAAPAAPRGRLLYAAAGLFAAAALALFLWPSGREEGVLLRTEPAGVKVSIDGALQPGETPMRLRLPPGEVGLVLRREGCAPWEGRFGISPELGQLFVVLDCGE